MKVGTTFVCSFLAGEVVACLLLLIPCELTTKCAVRILQRQYLRELSVIRIILCIIAIWLYIEGQEILNTWRLLSDHESNANMMNRLGFDYLQTEVEYGKSFASSQRNFLIALLSLVLWFVIRRMALSVTRIAQLTAKLERRKARLTSSDRPAGLTNELRYAQPKQRKHSASSLDSTSTRSTEELEKQMADLEQFMSSNYGIRFTLERHRPDS